MDEKEKIADSIRSGAYFNDARAWYQAMYIGPISERTFFMIIASLASIVAFMAIIAMVSLMPITTQTALIVPTRGEVDSTAPRIIALHEKKDSVGDSLVNFFLANYVVEREKYSAATWESSAGFVHSHSDAATYEQYVAQRQPENPQSLAATLGRDGELEVSIASINAHTHKGTGTATVVFFTHVKTAAQAVKTKWTAQVKYQYTDVTIDAVTNAENGMEETKITDPEFQVTGYVVQKN